MNTIVGSTTLRPLAPAQRSPHASALAGAWFEAAAPGGSLRLYAAGTARHAADAAVALMRCEALLDALDEWLGAALDWRWIAAPAAVTSTASHARAVWRPEDAKGRKEHGCRLELPWSLLRVAPAPDEPLARQLQWADVPVVLAIAQLSVERDEIALLEPGGAVVLPASMHPGWHGTLRAVDEPSSGSSGVPVALASPWSPRRVRLDTHSATRERAAVEKRVACEVRLAVPHAVAADRLGGWFEGDLGEVGSRAGLWRCGTEREPAVCLAAGELMPWGDGWALAIRDLYEIRQTGG